MQKRHFLSFYINIFACLKPVFEKLIANLLKKLLITADILHSGYYQALK